MATLRELKSRIGSVASTEKTTSAMKMISSAKMHKFTGQLQRIAPYQEMVQQVLSHLLVTDQEFNSPLIEVREVHNLALVVFGSDDGLCGAFNINIFKRLMTLVAESREQMPGVNITVIPVGKKITKAVQKVAGKEGLKVENFEWMNTRSTQDDLQRFTQELKSRFLDHTLDRVDMVYMHFKSTSKQILTVEQLLPVSYEGLKQNADLKAAASPCLFEPDAATLFNTVLPLHMRAMVQAVFTQSAASEQASRVMAMQTASDNAKDLLDDLNLEYNKLRQQSITTELLDILGGQTER